MKTKIINWNIRRLNDPQTREIVRNCLQDWRGDIIFLQETKFDSVSDG